MRNVSMVQPRVASWWRYIILAFILSISVPGLLFMAIPGEAAITQPGAWTQIYTGTANTTGNVSYNVPSGSDRVLVVTVATESASNVTFTTSGTYNSVGLTRVANASDDTASQRVHTAILYIPEASLPASGAYNLSVTTGGTLQRMVWLGTGRVSS